MKMAHLWHGSLDSLPENILFNQFIRLFQNCRNSDTRQSHPAFNF